ncbi:MAG: hypothetical protein AB7S26_19325 [Sandaracinaceae bacterium]
MTVAIAIASAWYHLGTPAGGLAARDLVHAIVRPNIRGELRVDGVRFAHGRLYADRLRAWTPEHTPVLDLRSVELEPNLFGCVTNLGFVVDRAWVTRGEIWISGRDGQRLSSIEQAFESPKSMEGGGQGAPHGQGTNALDIDDIRFENLTTMLSWGDAVARLDGAHGRGHLWIERGSEIELRFYPVSGNFRMNHDLVPDARIDGLTLRISPVSDRFVSFATDARVLGHDVGLAGHAPQDSGRGLMICMWTGGEAEDAVLGVTTDVIGGLLSGDVSLDARMTEIPEDARCEERHAHAEDDREDS